MEFGEDGWDHPGIGVWPERWRQEVEQASSNRDVVRSVSGRDRDSYWWDHGQGIKVTDTRNLKTSLTSWWVPGTLWVRAPAQRELVAVAETVLERPTARIRIMPDRAGWAAGPFHSGDEHEIEVDIATGLTLAVTSFVDGASFHHDEVTEFETEPTISPALTAVPAGAERVPATQGFRSVEEIAAATPLSLLAPRWLPPEFMFQTGGVFIRDGVPEANLVYSRDRRVFVSLYEWPESRLPGEETIEWEPIDRGSRTVLMSDQSDRPGKRIARTTLDGTVAFIDADLPAPELLQLAFSLDVVCP
jgi:hypothetical protein